MSLTIDFVSGAVLGSGGSVFQTITADLAGDATSEAACLTGTFPHRFSYTLAAAQVTAQRGKAVYAYARSPAGLPPVRFGSTTVP